MAYLLSRRVTVTAADATISEKRSREYLLLQNTHATDGVSVHFGDGDATTTNGVLLAAGEVYTIEKRNDQKIAAIALVGSVDLIINEG